MMHQAVLFDLDGTLLDTLEDLADSCNRTMAAHGYPTHPIDAYRYFVGDGVTNLIRRALPELARTESLVRDCIQTYRADYTRNWNNKTRPYAGIPQMLDALASRGVKLAVLSNKPDDFTRLCVSHFLPRWRFDAIQGASEAFAHKPDPAGAIHIARLIGVEPGSFLYLGDTATDMQTAQAAGMFAVGALWGFRPRAELEQAGARVVIGRPQELLDLL